MLIVQGLSYFKLLDQSSITYEMNETPVDAEPNYLSSDSPQDHQTLSQPNLRVAHASNGPRRKPF